MASISEKHRKAVVETSGRLVTRAENARSLKAQDVSPRVEYAVTKYLLRDDPNTAEADIRKFVEEINADDLCLVIACENGDQSAWKDLVANFDSTVRSAARKVSANAEDSDDLASSIWAELYGLRRDADGKRKSKLAYYTGRGSLAGWLRAVVSQLAVDEFRKQSRFVQIEEEREFENLAEGSSENSDHGRLVHLSASPEEMVTDKQMSGDVAEALRKAIGTLESEDKLILKLYYFDDLRLKEIGQTFGYHEATASRKLARIQNEIRKSVEKTLKNEYGWSPVEVSSYLSETAAKLGVDLEKMFTILMFAAILQEMHTAGVL